MTTLEAPPLAKELLRCATAILQSIPCQVDLSWTEGHLGSGDAIFSGPLLEALRYNIEEKSDRQLTIRRVDSIMAPTTVSGKAIWLTLCPIDTPDEQLTRPIEGKALILITPTRDGLQQDITPLSLDQIKRRETERATRRAVQQRQVADRAARDTRVAEARAITVAGLQFYQRQHELDTEGGQTSLSPSQLERIGSMRFDEILALCDELGVDLIMVNERGLQLRRTSA